MSFILTSPKQLDAGSTERLSLVLLNVIGRGDVTVSLMDANDTVLSRCVTAVITSGLTQVYINLTVPDLPPQITSGKLKIHGSCGRFRFFEERIVGIRHMGIILFIVSDKEIYLPGETVKYRTLAVNSQLQVLGKLVKADVVVRDPNGVCVSQHVNVSMSIGLLDLTIDLPTETVLGLWAITVRVQNTKKTHTFTVDLYVPPKFEVIIIPPSYVLATARTITWKICAEYASRKRVMGTIKLFAQLSQYSHELLSSKYSLAVEDKITGCYNYTADCNRLGFFDATQRERSIELIAEVTEEETGITEVAKNTLCRVDKPVHLRLITHNPEEYFKPGLPYIGKLQVSAPDSTPIADVVVRICIIVSREQWTENRWEGVKSRFCKHFTSSRNGQVKFTVHPQKIDTVSMQIKFRAILFGIQATDKISARNEPQLIVTLHPWYSPSGSFLQIETVTEEFICGNAYMFNILFTAAEKGVIKFIYQLTARGEIVDQGILPYMFKAESNLVNYTDATYLPFDDHMKCSPLDSSTRNVQSPTYIGRFNIILVPPANLSPKAHFLLYYVSGNGETVADEKTFKVSGCLGNNVSVVFSKEVGIPKSNIAILIRGSPHSLCGVSAQEKSANSLSEKNQLSRTQVFHILESYDVSKYTYPIQPTPDWKWCEKEYEEQGISEEIFNVLKIVGYVDEITAFNDAGLVVLTNNELETRPCKPYDFTSNIISSVRDSKYQKCALQNPDGALSTFHAESWLWEIERLSADGSFTLIRKLPDHITKWSADAICMSPVTGLGVAVVSAPVVTFRPFGVTLTAPSSVVRGEIVTIVATIANYLQECAAIQLTLERNADFDLSNCTESVEFCVCPEGRKRHEFRIVPQKVGTINVEVRSSSLKHQNLCPYHVSQAIISAKEVVSQEFQVLNEGFPVQRVKTTYFCFENYSAVQKEFELSLPENVVDNSTEVIISVTGDLMGPVFNHLQNLIPQPLGCAEQIMVDVVPSAVTLEYLNKTNQLTKPRRVRLLHNIHQGCIKILSFCHASGAYSPFGSRDLHGSVWLTSYILWSLEEASKYIFIDQDHLTKTRKWILSQQLENGCYPAIGMTTIHSNSEGSVASNSAIVTAYTVIALWNSGYQNDTMMYDKAVECMKSNTNHTDYSLALYSYAFSLIRGSEAQDYLNTFECSNITSGNLNFWIHGISSNKALLVEIASYIVLAYLHLDCKDNIVKVTPIIQWIVQQRNPNGGFHSSQDTVMGIRALAKYAESANAFNLFMTINSITHKGIGFTLNNTHRLTKQSARVHATPRIALSANGTGCAQIQIEVLYSITTPPPSKKFFLKLNTTRGIRGNCQLAQITACFSFPMSMHFSMIILQIRMVSGFSPVFQSLNKLLRNSNLKFKKYQFEENELVCYFIEPKNTPFCLSFEVIQLHFVSKLLPAIAEISYYNTEETVSVFYAIDEECPLEQQQKSMNISETQKS